MNRFSHAVTRVARILLVSCSLVTGVVAVASDDPAMDERMRNLASELRCLVCQNQSLIDSDAPLAVDLRRELRSKLENGATDAEVVDYLVDRYGDFVLYRPRFKAETLLLWLGPLILVVVTLTLFARALRRRNTAVISAGEDADSDSEEKLSW